MNYESATAWIFLLYMGGVFLLAIFSHKLFASKSFLSEYFLGSRGLGTWALAFSFAATSASGGSFTGYPSLIYTYGWVLAFWIASYMIVPIVTMGLMGKRLNQVARRAEAITIPDVLRERYSSTGLALFATCTIIFFTITNLIAQFKAGGIILNVLLEDIAVYKSNFLPWFSGLLNGVGLNGEMAGYICGLLLFSVTVVVYTAYGGFRAVVWTDVMQGVVMGIGVLVLIPFVLHAAGGLVKVTTDLNQREPLAIVGLKINKNVLEFRAVDGVDSPLFIDLSHSDGGQTNVEVVESSDDSSVTIDVSFPEGTSANAIKQAIDQSAEATALISVTVPPLDEINGIKRSGDPNDGSGAVVETDGPLYLAAGTEKIFAPGKKRDSLPFHPFEMGISFFFMWAISGAGQPGTMVRLMAFENTKILRRAIFTVTLYFGSIYLPMVLIFVSAQSIVHPAELSTGSDQIMPQLAKTVAPFWLAGILIAAPFAAVMSTVDSFLLMISSSLVRDVYQRTINPNISERAIKIGSYTTTAVVGGLVTILAFNPPEFLQYIIVFTGGGFAATFLAPMFLGLYWKGMTKVGAWCAMVGGFSTIVGLFSAGHILNWLNFDVPAARINPFGFHPIVVGLAVSFILGIGMSLITPRLPENVVRRFFAREEDMKA